MRLMLVTHTTNISLVLFDEMCEYEYVCRSGVDMYIHGGFTTLKFVS